jgi:hypothetical protein
MTQSETEAFATWLPAAEAARVRDAVEQTGLSKSDLVARALRYYAGENPDAIPAFHTNDQRTGPLKEAGILPQETESNWIGSGEP